MPYRPVLLIAFQGEIDCNGETEYVPFATTFLQLLQLEELFLINGKAKIRLSSRQENPDTGIFPEPCTLRARPKDKTACDRHRSTTLN